MNYQQSTGCLTLDQGTYKVAVDGVIPGGNAVVIGPVNLSLAGKTDYDVIAVNSVGSIEPLVLSDTGSLNDNTKVFDSGSVALTSGSVLAVGALADIEPLLLKRQQS